MTFEKLEKYIMQNANLTYDYPFDESSDVDEETIKELLDHSFELVSASLTKK